MAHGSVSTHPLAEVVRDAAAGRWPADDGRWTLLPSWRPGVSAIVAMTGHAFICTDRPLDPIALGELGCDGHGGATLPAVVQHVAGPDGWIDCLDVLLVGCGTSSGDAALVDAALVDRPDLAAHGRAMNAGRSRGQVRVLGYADPSLSDLVTVAQGLAGLSEIGVEAGIPGRGSRLFADVLASVPAGEIVVAGIAPGNARSLRSALRAGFAVIGSVQIMVQRSGI